MGETPDKEFAAFLRRSGEVSRAYRQLPRAEAPAQLGERITGHARNVLPPRHHQMRELDRPVPMKPSWLAPIALAASVLLSIAVLLGIAVTPRTHRPADSALRLLPAVSHEEDRAQARYPRSPGTRAAGGAAERGPYLTPLLPRPRLYSTDPPGSHPVQADHWLPPVPVEVIRRDPQAWRARIEQLQRDGRLEEARAEEAAFHKVFPDYR
ncbi:MAG: hypothetical protein U1F35_20410 [Steroidobacteraceae bacterium]